MLAGAAAVDTHVCNSQMQCPRLNAAYVSSSTMLISCNQAFQHQFLLLNS